MTSIHRSWKNGGGLHCYFPAKGVAEMMSFLDGEMRAKPNHRKRLIDFAGRQPDSDVFALNPELFINSNGDVFFFFVFFFFSQHNYSHIWTIHVGLSALSICCCSAPFHRNFMLKIIMKIVWASFMMKASISWCCFVMDVLSFWLCYCMTEIAIKPDYRRHNHCIFSPRPRAAEYTIGICKENVKKPKVPNDWYCLDPSANTSFIIIVGNLTFWNQGGHWLF